MKFFSFCILWCLAFSLKAQTIKQSIAYNTRDITTDFFVGDIHSKQAILLNTDSGYVIKLFNTNMGELETIAPKYLDNKVLDCFVRTYQNLLFMVFTKNINGTIHIYEATYNPQIKDPTLPVLLDTLQISNNHSKLYFAKSDNMQHSVLWHEEVLADRTLLVRYRQWQNNRYNGWDTLKIGEIDNRFHNSVYVSNTGVMSLVADAKSKNGNIQKSEIFVPSNNILGKVIEILPDVNCKNTLSAFNQFNNKIHFLRMLTIKEGKLKAVEHSIVDLQGNISQRQIDTLFSFSALNYENEGSGSFFPKELLFVGADNVIAVAEYYGKVEVQQNNFSFQPNMSFMGQGRIMNNNSITRYTSGNILVNYFLQNEKPSHKLIRKVQSSDGRPSSVAGFGAALLPDGIHFMHNIIENQKDIEHTVLRLNKQYASTMLEARAKYQGVALFDRSVQITSSSILVPCVEQSGISFLRINFN